jgi:quinolinate synthase
MSEAERGALIRRTKEALGESLTILGHHYQRDEVIQFADFRGDSLDLSRRAAQVDKARTIVFCGVHFMAETAAMLCRPGVVVVQPEIEAMCPMAAMANRADAEQAWAALNALWPDDLVPICYQNSTAEVKAWVGERGGAVCTSANADKMFAWAWQRKGHLLFLPDEHLGTNTALAMGLSRAQIGVWDPVNPPDPRPLAAAKVVVWQGFCHVHTAFTPDDVREARRHYPGCIIVVHPECPHEVAELADKVGSTTAIIKVAQDAPAGATIVVGTELHLVQRLQLEQRDKTIVPLRRSSCPNMAMTTTAHLAWALEMVLAGQPHHIVTVAPEVAHGARLALERMLKVG